MRICSSPWVVATNAPKFEAFAEMNWPLPDPKRRPMDEVVRFATISRFVLQNSFMPQKRKLVQLTSFRPKLSADADSRF